MIKNKKILSVLIVALLLVSVSTSAFAYTEYRVQPGDNLYNIGQKFGLNHKNIMMANSLENCLIRPGQTLSIPGDKGMVYSIQSGDNLYRIAKKFGISLRELQRLNKIDNSIIYPGQKLMIPVSGENNQSEPVLAQRVKTYISEKDIELLARLIHAEARGEDYHGQVAVGAVILNRLASEQFPDNLRDVVFQRTKGVYQFTPVRDGSINLPPSEEAVKAAKEALAGQDPTDGALFFYNPKISTDKWIKTLPTIKTIGNHVFAK